MDTAFLHKIVEGSPLIVIILIAAIIAIWREWKNERDKHMATLQTSIDLGHRVVTSIDKLAEVVKAQKGN